MNENTAKEVVNVFFGKENRIRKGWGDMNPVSRIHSKEGKTGHKPKFNKARRGDWKKGLDW
jgi:hypothetical protein